MQNRYPNYPPYQNNPRQTSAPPRQGLAIASMIVGILSLFTFGGFFVGAITGIILGMTALNKAGKNRMLYGGNGYAISGIVLSSVSIPLSFILAAIAIPNLLASRRTANAASAIQTIRLIHAAESNYQATVGNGSFGSAEDLFKQGLIDPDVANAADVPPTTSTGGQYCNGTGLPKAGYKYRITYTKLLPGKLSTFNVVGIAAETQGSKRSGNRNFFVDESGVIRYSNYAAETPDQNSSPLNN